jgi:hypothetical protein
MLENSQDKLCVNVNVEISATALQAIVANAKRLAPRSPDGTYCIDTADQVSAMISLFLEERNFDRFVREKYADKALSP